MVNFGDSSGAVQAALVPSQRMAPLSQASSRMGPPLVPAQPQELRVPQTPRASMAAAWERRESRSTPGLLYYRNKQTGATQFELPAELASPSTLPSAPFAMGAPQAIPNQYMPTMGSVFLQSTTVRDQQQEEFQAFLRWRQGQ